MSGIALASSRSIDLPPHAVFPSLASSSGGWLFGAQCDVVAVGRPISLEVPFGLGGGTFRVHGWISAVREGAELVVEHVQPWHGRIRVRVAPAGASASRVSLTCDIDEDGVDWLVRRSGVPVPIPPRRDVVRIGLLTSKTGPGAVFALAAENAAALAVADMDADGGARRHEILVGDDATDPSVARAEAERLVAAGCRGLVAAVTSSSFARAREVATRHGIPAVHAVLNEGGRPLRSALRLGERPEQQIAAAARPLMREAGSTTWFLVGHTYSWSLGSSRRAREIVPAAGGRIVGEARVPLGRTDYAPVVERILRSGAGVVLTSLVGEDEVAFERASHRMGLRERAVTFSLVLEEATRERVGIVPSTGVWSAMSYYADLPSETNRDFVRRYRDRFGPWAPPLSTMSEAVHSAVVLLARALRAEPDASAPVVVDALRRLTHEAPRGRLAFGDEETYGQSVRLAVGTADGFRIL